MLPDYLFNGTTGAAPDEDQLAAFITHNGPASAGINAEVFHLMDPNCSVRADCFITPAMCAQVCLLERREGTEAMGEPRSVFGCWYSFVDSVAFFWPPSCR
jgi:hypothetical protein